ncbi:MAG: hypothetical protein U1E70_15285 [Acetobacteraceae bacterium]
MLLAVHTLASHAGMTTGRRCRQPAPGALIPPLLLAIMLQSTAWAHVGKDSADRPADGLPIPSLTHGQMAVIASNLGAIRALADRWQPTDPVMRRLQGYVSLQSFACLWGLVPGSVSDEDSPFNECAHAYLAGAQALLLHLQQMSGPNRAEADALVTRIEREMLENNTALVLCRFSGQGFNTGTLIWPEWRGIPFHLPSLAMVLAPLLVGGIAVWVRLRTRPAVTIL